MKAPSKFLLAAALALGASVAPAQDDQKPAPPPIPPTAPAPDVAGRPPGPGQDQPPPPRGRDGRDGRSGDHRDGGPRPPEAGRRGEGQFHPEGERRPDGGRHFQGPMQFAMPPVPTKPTPYVGVITASVPPVLTAQLGLAEGFGLVVGEVLPESPAAKAGFQRYDVLTKMNDQQLVDPNQLSTLVRALKKDAEVTFTYVRKAQEQTVTLKIDERMLPVRRSFPGPGGLPGDMRRPQGDAGQPRGPMPGNFDPAPNFGDRMREFQERMKARPMNPSADSAQPPSPSQDAPPPIPPEDILREARPGGLALIRLFQPDGTVTYDTANTRLVMKDEAGEIEIAGKDGKRSLVAKNTKGETIFDGPIDTEEQRNALPEEVRKKVESIEVQTKVAQARTEFDGNSGPDVDVQ